MKKYIYLAMCSMTVIAAESYAQINPATCEPTKPQRDLYTTNAYKRIYPYKALDKEIIACRINRLTEGKSALTDLREINLQGLTSGKTKTQPWGGSYWPLMHGLAANTYQDKDYEVFIRSLPEWTSWKYNYKKYLKRTKKIHPRVEELSEKELSKLSPSEKYDILLGDPTFDLTNKLWNYTKKIGEENQWGYLSSVVVPEGYELHTPLQTMKFWEGLCHGWATASGHSPRPEKTVTVKLPSGKVMPFYPTDLKALVTLLWSNSTVQDAVIMEGYRCNNSNPEKDEFGRYIDRRRDEQDKTLLSRCSDVHPAIYHAAVVNILGVEGRSFIVDRSSKKSVNNHPVSAYSYKYFNPKNGVADSFNASVVAVSDYQEDPFKISRHPETHYIVGVEMNLQYIEFDRPNAQETNSPEDDRIEEIGFSYDLELDKNYKMIGGQWRVKNDGSARVIQNRTDQPDFFWVIPKDYKKYFKKIGNLPEWNIDKSPLPPKEFLPAAKVAHGFIYQMTAEFGSSEKCKIKPINGDEIQMVPCEYRVPKPQPLINVIDTLLEASKL